MRPKLAIAILVLALSGDSGAAWMCAAYCMSYASAGSAAVHHHQLESQPNPASISHPIHVHARHHGADCAECPPKSGNSLNQKADCASLVQVQALKEGSFSFEPSSGAVHVDVAHTPADALALAGGGERSIPSNASDAIGNSDPASVPLRI